MRSSHRFFLPHCSHLHARRCPFFLYAHVLALGAHLEHVYVFRRHSANYRNIRLYTFRSTGTEVIQSEKERTSTCIRELHSATSMSVSHAQPRGGIAALRASLTSSGKNESTPNSNTPAQHSTSSFFDSQQGLDLATSSIQDFAPSAGQHTTDNLDFSRTNGGAHEELLQDAVFPEWRDDAAGLESFETPEEMQQKDPLGTQIWKLYSRAKTRMPNQERMYSLPPLAAQHQRKPASLLNTILTCHVGMENLTWRMMAMNLRRREQEQQRAAYAMSTLYPRCDTNDSFSLAAQKAEAELASRAQQQTPKPVPRPQKATPSGISKLRESNDAAVEPFPDAMNLDDFIVPTSVASPAGLPTPSSSDAPFSTQQTQYQGIPISQKQKSKLQAQGGPASSLPRNTNSGFDGLPRRMRKTSIDERRIVCTSLLCNSFSN